jgi:hypothetical protein
MVAGGVIASNGSMVAAGGVTIGDTGLIITHLATSFHQMIVTF